MERSTMLLRTVMPGKPSISTRAIYRVVGVFTMKNGGFLMGFKPTKIVISRWDVYIYNVGKTMS